jgi:cytochrome c oxidase assembly protein subunit 15
VQIIYGGFVAGLNAGLIHNHWPLMSDGQLFHESILLEKESWILRFTEGKSGVQFIHRTLAYLVVGCIVFLYFKGRKHMLSLAQKRGLRMLLLLVLIQFILGVLTLLLGVPMWLGLTHQIMAFLLLATMTFTLHRLSK